MDRGRTSFQHPDIDAKRFVLEKHYYTIRGALGSHIK